MYKLLIAVVAGILMVSGLQAEDLYTDDRKLHIHYGKDELGSFNWGQFLTCLATSRWPGDPGPRELNLATSRLVMTRIADELWVISIRETIEKVVLVTITIDTRHYYMPNDKLHLFLRIVGNCKLDNSLEKPGSNAND